VPGHPAVLDLLADLEPEGVAVEGQGLLRIGMREECRVNDDVHGRHVRCGSATCASRFLTGRVTRFSTHGGRPAGAPATWRRYTLGGTPTSSVKRVLNVPNDEHPTAKHTSVTLRSPRRSNAI